MNSIVFFFLIITFFLITSLLIFLLNSQHVSVSVMEQYECLPVAKNNMSKFQWISTRDCTDPWIKCLSYISKDKVCRCFLFLSFFFFFLSCPFDDKNISLHKKDFNVLKSGTLFQVCLKGSNNGYSNSSSWLIINDDITDFG